MRAAYVIGAVLLAGCASNRGHTGYCSVLQYGGKIGVPYGLVSLDPELEASLRAQLPPHQATGYICWYATGDEILAANRGGGTVYGRIFRRSGPSWIATDKEESIILELPPH
mgnify:CR=1 FL=1|jgi:hypothetical protein